MSPASSDDTSMMEQPPQQRRRRRSTVEENTHQFDIVSLLLERGMQDLANERLHALLEGGDDDVDDEEEDTHETAMYVEDTHDDDGHTIEAAADHHINIEPQTSSEPTIIQQDLQSQEEQLQARIQEMEYELSIRRARTERLRAVINVVQSFHNTASSPSYRHPYHHQKEIRRGGSSIPPPPMIPTLEVDESSIILISPCISRSNSVCSSLDGYDDEEEEPSPPCKKQRR